MPNEHKIVSDYIRELRETRNDKPQQIQEALDIYIELWERVIEKKIVDPSEDIDSALSKVEASGGLYKAAQEEEEEEEEEDESREAS